MEESEHEINCFISDEVVYLRDSGKEPSLNTLIRQDLQQGSNLCEVDLRSPVPSKDSLQDTMISPDSEDLLLNYAAECYDLDGTDYYPLQKNTQKVIVPSLARLALAIISKQCDYSDDKSAHFRKSCAPASPTIRPNDGYHSTRTQNEPSTSAISNDILSDFDPWVGDYSPDDDDSDYQVDDGFQNISHTSCESTEHEVVQPVRKRKRAKRGKAVKHEWTAESNKIKRMKGESYKGRRKTENGKVLFDVERGKRCVQSRCEHNSACKFFECHRLTDEMRKKLFDNYWKLSWEAKKVWVQQTVQKLNVATRKCSGNYRRSNTYKYSFNESGINVKVCKKMYLNTLNIGEWSVHNWAKKEIKESSSPAVKTVRNVNVASLEEFGREYCKEFLNTLPKLESHYCRKSTSKLYLEPIWQSKHELYREYIRKLEELGKEKFKVSINTFQIEFEAMNLSLFRPKKDQCDLCCAYKVGNVSEEVYTQHRNKKERARDEKVRDKENIDSEVKVFTFDLQAVLLSPCLKASALYYKTKLKVHNFTIFDIQTKEAHCFIWNECEGGVTADEFSSILHYFINNHVTSNAKHIILWSDGCTNQNRNAILANSLLQVAVQKGITITHKYLEKGHTQMECDSMHSTIERQLRNREIYSPCQYVEVCKTARLNRPYTVHYLQHGFFRRFSTMPYLNSIRPGKKAGEATVFDLRCIEYRSNGKIYVKKEFTEEFGELPRRIKKPNSTDYMPPLYENRIPIQRSKFIHLQELKEVLPHDVHSFYDNLPHQCPNGRGPRGNENCPCIKPIDRTD